MKRRILAMLLTLCLVATMMTAVPVAALADTYGDYTYTVSDGEVTITDFKQSVSGAITIPREIEGYPVTGIGHQAFYCCWNLTNIIIPDSVTSIGDKAFASCYGLTNITIPDSVTSIGERAFYYCGRLTDITIPDSVTSMGEGAFEGCDSLTDITISDGVTSIGVYAFSSCDSLTDITIPDSVTSIGEGAFSNCDSLTDITIPDSVTSLGDRVFVGCNGLTSITVDSRNPAYSSIDGNLFDKNQTTLIQYAIGKTDTSYVVPNSVTSIDSGAFYGCSSLTGITIPDSVTNIGDQAFATATNLTSVTLGDSVTSIGEQAFDWCLRLTNITLPDSVMSIGNRAFGSCEKLTSINIPYGVTSIGSDVFIGCSSLTDITIPDGVTDIGAGAFSYCSSLTSITIPDSVTSIGEGAFIYSDNLTDVYYSGSEEYWQKMTINSYGNYSLLWATIHYNYFLPKDYDYNGYTSVSNGTFNFASGKGKASYNYHDNYFENSAYGYNHDLAKCSMRVALAAFGKIEGETDTTSGYYGNAYINIEQMLYDMGFDGIDHNDWYEEVPTTESIGVAVGKKHIVYPDGNYTLIAVAIRGGNYKAEWGGNFDVGNGALHEGFAIARDQVIEYIKGYIKDQRIGGKIKLWITGYSRAAATTNLTAAYLDENPEELSQQVTLTPENIYAYCFEAPAGVMNPDNESGLYNNIFSIVNQHDFVPMLAMRKWGYDRYGITKYLPSAQTNSNYIALRDGTDVKDGMVDYYAQYQKSKYIVDDFKYHYLISGTVTDIKTGLYYGQGVFLDRFMDKLADAIGSPANYTNNYQEIFEYVGEKIIGEEIAEPLMNSFVREFEERELILKYEAGGTILSVLNPMYGFAQATVGVGSAYYTLRTIVKEAFGNLGITVNDTVLDGITDLLISVGVEDAYTLYKNGKNLKKSHYPELCMAWLDAIDENDFADVRLRTLYLNCPVDFEVYDSNDNLVAAVYDDIPQEIEGSAIVPYVDENGQKVVYLPQDEEYRVEVIATDDGEVTYSVQEQDIHTGETKVINYNNMTVRKDDTMTGRIENLNETENAVYPLSSSVVEISDAEIIEKAEPIKINVDTAGNGVASGDGSFYKGEYVQVSAQPFENEEFLGWYNGEQLVSEEAVYRFQVTESFGLTAKFTENTCAITLLDSEEAIVGTNRVMKGSSFTLEDKPQKQGYAFGGLYTDSEMTKALTPEDVFYEDTVLYVKWVEDIEITEAAYKNQTVQVHAVMTDEMAEKAGVMFIALYDDDRLVDFTQVVPTQEINHTFESIEETEKPYTVKIMYWDNLINLRPLNHFESAVVAQ